MEILGKSRQIYGEIYRSKISKKRLDYAIAFTSLTKRVMQIEIDIFLMDAGITDHAAVTVDIAVDFDGTLCFSKWPDTGKPNQPLIKYLKRQKYNGSQLILWTCRSGTALDKAVTWCREVANLDFDAVNDNIPDIIELYGNNSSRL